MKKALPEYTVNGVTFLVDVSNHALIDKNDKRNVISFHEMAYRGSHYEMWFQMPIKTGTPVPMSRIYEHTRAQVPQMKELDPEGMAEKI